MAASNQKSPKIFNRSSVSQDGRIHDALLPSYVKIDDRDINDYLAYMVDYASKINYYDFNDEVNGSWTEFFLKDISVLISVIMHTDLPAIDRERIRLLEEVVTTESRRLKIGKLKNLFYFILQLGHRIDFWYTKSIEIVNVLTEERPGIESELESIISMQLSKSIRELAAYDLGAKESIYVKKEIEQDYSTFSAIWKMNNDITPINIYDELDKPHQSINQGVKKIDLIFRSFRNAISYLLNVAPRYLKISLEEKNNHSPDIALFISFLKVFEEVKGQLNHVTKKHLDYYYKTILQQEPKHATRDKVFMCFELADFANQHILKKETQLLGDKNDFGVAPIYTVDEETILTQAQIVDLKTVFVSKNLLIGTGSSYRLISNIFSAPIANSVDGRGESFERDKVKWATFGEEQLDKTVESRTMDEAEVGFVVASPILYLQEGKRMVDVSFLFNHDSGKTFQMLLEDISTNRQFSIADTFNQIFNNSIKLFLTGEEGWLEIDRYEVRPSENWDNVEVHVGFTLDQSFPAVVGNNPDFIEEYIDSEHPLMKVILTAEESSYAYSFLRELFLETVVIKVNVEKIKSLDLYNDIGRLDENLPFQPFGAAPKVGSYLAIGYIEAFKKELTELKFDIEWQDLPITRNGFDDYYEEYPVELTNETFEVNLTALTDHEYAPSEDEDQLLYKLFQYEKGENYTTPLLTKTLIEGIPLDKLHIKPDYHLETISNLNNNTKTGFFKLELINPPDAFGHEIYPRLFTDIVTENARNVGSKGLFKKGSDDEDNTLQNLPEAPYTPTIKKLSLGYSAVTRLDFAVSTDRKKNTSVPEQFYHIHPFGYEKTFANGYVHKSRFLPVFDEDGYLYIGLEKLSPPAPLTIYFQLAESKKGYTRYRTPQIIWSYLSSNEWIVFPGENILADGTDGFTDSGIVRLEIPADINKKNTILSPQSHWLRVAVKGDVDILSSTVMVQTQAAVATWNYDEHDIYHLDQPLMSSSITRMAEEEPEIREVVQVFPSFGGKKQENSSQFYTRVSERLRHKGRAITNWDYERLVLEKFPQIQQVKCLSHMTHPQFIEHGKVVLVVIPAIDKFQFTNEPKANFNILKRIRDYLQEIASSFSTIEVRNSTYERVKVACNVVFQKGKSNGWYLQQLNRDINEYLSPRMSGSNNHLNLGGSINRDLVVNYLEQRPYVRFVTKSSLVQLVVDDDGKHIVIDTAMDESGFPIIEASRPWSVLVPVEKHQITLIDEENFTPPDPGSLGNMQVQTDFIIFGENQKENIVDRIEAQMKMLAPRFMTDEEKEEVTLFLKFGFDLD